MTMLLLLQGENDDCSYFYREYKSNITFTNNTVPTYAIGADYHHILRVGVAEDVVIPAATDTQSHTIYYHIDTTDLPGTVTYAQSVTYSNQLNFTAPVAADVGNYTLVLSACESVNAVYCTNLTVHFYINQAPVEAVTFPSNPNARVPYTSTSDIALTCPWWTDADGDTLTVTYLSLITI